LSSAVGIDARVSTFGDHLEHPPSCSKVVARRYSSQSAAALALAESLPRVCRLELAAALPQAFTPHTGRLIARFEDRR
jgi:hypothetical protein